MRRVVEFMLVEDGGGCEYLGGWQRDVNEIGGCRERVDCDSGILFVVFLYFIVGLTRLTLSPNPGIDVFYY